jgi:hypothetical protein
MTTPPGRGPLTHKEIGEIAQRALDAGQPSVAVILFGLAGAMAFRDERTLARLVADYGRGTLKEIDRIEAEKN